MYYCACGVGSSTLSLIDAMDACGGTCTNAMQMARQALREQKRAENERAQEIQRMAVRHS